MANIWKINKTIISDGVDEICVKLMLDVTHNSIYDGQLLLEL